MIFALSACGGNDDEATADDEKNDTSGDSGKKVTVTLWRHDGTPQEGEYYDAMIDDFNNSQDEIVIEQTFETHVPAPVLVLDPVYRQFDNVRPGFKTTYIVKATNKGLIGLDEVDISGDSHSRARFTPLITYAPSIGPFQTLDIPYELEYYGFAGNNRQSLEDDWKKAKMDCLVMLLSGAIAAASRVGLVMNVPRRSLEDVLALLPALTSPTISTLADEGWVSLTSVIVYLPTCTWPKSNAYVSSVSPTLFME